MYRAMLCSLSALVLLAGPALADDDPSPRKIRIRIEKPSEGDVKHRAPRKIVVKSADVGSEAKVGAAVRAWLRELMPKKDGALDTQAWFAGDRPQAKGLRDHLRKHGIDAARLGRWLDGSDAPTHVLHLDSDDSSSWLIRGDDVPARVRTELVERLLRSPRAEGRVGERVEMGQPHVEVRRERWIDDGQGWRRAPEEAGSPFGRRGSEFRVDEIRRLLERYGVSSKNLRDIPLPPRPRLVAPGGRGGRTGLGVDRSELEQIRDQLNVLRRRLDRALGEPRGEPARRRAGADGRRAPDSALRRIEELRRRIQAPKADAPAPEVREHSEILILGPDGKLVKGSTEDLLRQLEELTPDVEELKKLLQRLRGTLPEPKKAPK